LLINLPYGFFPYTSLTTKLSNFSVNNFIGHKITKFWYQQYAAKIRHVCYLLNKLRDQQKRKTSVISKTKCPPNRGAVLVPVPHHHMRGASPVWKIYNFTTGSTADGIYSKFYCWLRAPSQLGLSVENSLLTNPSQPWRWRPMNRPVVYALMPSPPVVGEFMTTGPPGPVQQDHRYPSLPLATCPGPPSSDPVFLCRISWPVVRPWPRARPAGVCVGRLHRPRTRVSVVVLV
jgi:hypothetical protein